MSYYSSVRLLTTRKGYDELSTFLKLRLPDRRENLIENCDFKKVHCNTVFMGWDSIKWYEHSNFSEIDAMLDGLKHLKIYNFSYHFIRMGEDYDDVDTKNVDFEEDKLDIYSGIDRVFNDEYIDSVLEREDERYKKDRKDKKDDILRD